jgi:hypothetical protein
MGRRAPGQESPPLGLKGRINHMKTSFSFVLFFVVGPSVSTFSPTQALPNSLERPDAVSPSGTLLKTY